MKLALGAFIATFLSGVVAAAVAAIEPPGNYHIDLVLKYLAEDKFELPKGDYILLAQQPMGIVSTTVIYELSNGRTTILPGHNNSDRKRETRPLSLEKAQLLRNVFAIEAVRKLSRNGEHGGLDGCALVAFIKLGNNRSQQIGHWQSESPVIELLTAIYHREERLYENRQDAQEQDKP